MRSARRRFLIGPALMAALAACGGGDGRSSDAATADTVAMMPAPAPPTGPRGESDGVIGVRVEQPPPPDSLPVGDRRTAVSAERLESPSFRVRWPRVNPGDPRVTVEGEARTARFAVAVVRGDSTVVVRPVAAEEPVAGWRRFSVTLPVAGGFREDDAVALITGPTPDSRELFFQPVRNRPTRTPPPS